MALAVNGDVLAVELELGVGMCDEHKEEDVIGQLLGEESNPEGRAYLIDMVRRVDKAEPDLDTLTVRWREI